MARKSKIIHVKIEAALKSELVAKAAEVHTPVSYIIREAIRQYLAPKPQPQTQEAKVA